MAINYEKINNGAGWDTRTSTGPTNFNHMEQGIKDACDGVDELEAKSTETDAEISEINATLTHTYQYIKPSYAYDDNTYVFLEKVGNVVSLRLATLKDLPSGVTTKILTLPMEYRPKMDEYRSWNVFGISGDLYYITVSTNGDVSVYKYATWVTGNSVIRDVLIWIV